MNKSGEISAEIADKLLRMAKDGNEKAFEQLVSLYEKKVYSMALYMLQNREDALDITQEVFIKLWQNVKTFRFECSVNTYLMKLTKNAVLDLKRKNSIRQTLPLTHIDSDGEETEIDLPDDDVSNDPVKSLERKESIELVRSAIASLDENYREVIILRDIRGLSYDEIADVLGVSEGTVKSRINRARKELKKLLEKRNFL